MIWAAPALAAGPGPDLTDARVLVDPRARGPERAAAALLVDEEAARTGHRWQIVTRDQGRGPVVVLARAARLRALAPDAPPALRRPGPAEGYRLRLRRSAGRPVVYAVGEDARGVLFAAGRLLQRLDLSAGRARVAAPLDQNAAPEVPVRGVQIGYRSKNNSYDAWTAPMLEQRVRDLALFGANTVQAIAPVSDDAPLGPAAPLTALEALRVLSGESARLGLDFALFYPLLKPDYGDPSAVEAEVRTLDAVSAALPRLDALYIPGGDPGSTPPERLLPVAERLAATVRARHPGARVWISAQGFDADRFARFYRLLRHKPAWLTGVFAGPQSRDAPWVQRRRLPRGLPLQLYPDIAHTMHAQVPVPQWDPAFALTEGREPIDPRPLAEASLYRLTAPMQRGFVVYSEGVTDDVNMDLWFALGWSRRARVREVLEDYARLFVAPGADARAFADALLGLEADWRGPAGRNRDIPRTLAALEALDPRVVHGEAGDWRFESALYRAVYDALVQRRAGAEAGRQAAALAALRTAPIRGSTAAASAALAALALPDDGETPRLRARLSELAERLYAHARLQLSVPLYGASGVERGANLDRADASLNDRVWLTKGIAAALSRPDEPGRRNALLALAVADGPPPGALAYDDLGEPGFEPHLVRGASPARDPLGFARALDGVADRTPDDGWRRAWTTYAEALYDHPLALRYRGLRVGRDLDLRVTFAGEDYARPIRVQAAPSERAATVELQPFRLRASNPQTVDLTIPARAIGPGGRLVVRFTAPPGAGGSGRGRQVAEVAVLPVAVSGPAPSSLQPRDPP